MLFNPAHTVLNQRANARKASVETTNLIGHWDPNDINSYGGVGTTYNNLVTSKEDLKIYGATFVNTSPKHFTFDGTDDKIADIDTSDPYDDNFEVQATYSFAVSMWLKFDNFASANVLWSLGTAADNGVFALMDGSQKDKISMNIGDNSFHIKNAFSAGYWYMVTFRVRHPHSNRALVEFFVNGVLVEIASLDTQQWHPMITNYTELASIDAQDFDIGYNENDDDYMNSATQLGAVLVYNGGVVSESDHLPNSAIWANYLATKDTYYVGSGAPPKR